MDLDRLPALALPDGRRLAVATTPAARARGLLGLAALPPSTGLLLAPCRSVHTAAMRFAIDLVWLGPGGGSPVLRVDAWVGPWRLRSCRAATAVVEVPAGHGRTWTKALDGSPSVAMLAPLISCTKNARTP